MVIGKCKANICINEVWIEELDIFKYWGALALRMGYVNSAIRVCRQILLQPRIQRTPETGTFSWWFVHTHANHSYSHLKHKNLVKYHVLHSEIICRSGAWNELPSNQGQNFMSRVITEQCKLFQIVKVKTPSYPPQINAYSAKATMNWDKLFPFIKKAYRV